jgi:hypothetical protein
VKIGGVKIQPATFARTPASRAELRDRFAAAALTGFLVGSVVCGREIGDGPKIARTAYAMADAMLAERERRVRP